MSNCKQCGKEIESHTGRRPKLYCGKTCRNAYINAHKPDKSEKVWKSTYDAVVLENTALKSLLKELQNGNPVMERGIKEVKVSELAKHAQNIDVISEESLVDLATKGVFATTNQDQINKLQGELALITGKSTMANDMRRNLQKRIDWIKSHPTQKA